MSAYLVLKTIHVAAVVTLFAIIAFTTRRKLAADRTGDPTVIAAAQKQAVGAEFMFTAPGVVTVTMAGYCMALAFIPNSWELAWLANGQRAFCGALFIWTVVIMPSQLIQSVIADKAREGSKGSTPPSYWFWRRVWALGGATAVALLLATVYFMAFKPD